MTASTIMNRVLRKLYYDISNPASFSSVENLFKEARKQIPDIKREDVQKFLSGELTYTLHRKAVHRFKRNPVVATSHKEYAQADLIDIQRYKASNDGNGFILTVVDVFSKLAFAIPVKSKSAKHMVEAFEKLFQTYRPDKLQTDEGNDFTNKQVQTLFKRYLVHWFVAKNEMTKCSIVERFQRTLMTKIHKYMTSKGTQAFINLLPDFLRSYNNSYHRSIRMTPIQASNASPKQVFKNLYGCEDERALLRKMIVRPKLGENDEVRIQTQKGKFNKGYTQNFTDHIYKIINARPGVRRPVYTLADHKGKRIKGNFYAEEIQKVRNTDVYRVQVLQERKRGRGKQYLVRYENFPDTAPEWIAASKLQTIS